jgi:hypothetical protein
MDNTQDLSSQWGTQGIQPALQVRREILGTGRSARLTPKSNSCLHIGKRPLCGPLRTLETLPRGSDAWRRTPSMLQACQTAWYPQGMHEALRNLHKSVTNPLKRNKVMQLYKGGASTHWSTRVRPNVSSTITILLFPVLAGVMDTFLADQDCGLTQGVDLVILSLAAPLTIMPPQPALRSGRPECNAAEHEQLDGTHAHADHGAERACMHING